MIIKFFSKTIIFFLALVLLVAILQIGAIYYLSHADREIAPSDLIVVFPGDKGRIIAGCDLALEGYAPELMVVNEIADKIAAICRKSEKQNSGKTVNTITGGKSRSTFEDVYNTMAAIEHHNIRSVILVTSASHLPRAAFLLKMSLALKGHHDVTVHLHPVAEEWVLSKKLKLYYNELAKLFGSTAEMTGYFLSGQLMLDSPRFSEARSFLKKHLLFSP